MGNFSNCGTISGIYHIISHISDWMFEIDFNKFIDTPYKQAVTTYRATLSFFDLSPKA